ncbi:hypothetical protein Ctha_2335 [Chloroherpeton thalassium ATCC 35110]|uniref:Uncharacterized protein n=1 Tax=Chloroherpeton thalassium (strain ATCC 35110 / GB-78) TaxID=517418 RepID=B3QWM5_CHLT3|nr:hypothetical protein Ctha_2335 [Chloroherpeton thalassium ATCC 35110]
MNLYFAFILSFILFIRRIKVRDNVGTCHGMSLRADEKELKDVQDKCRRPFFVFHSVHPLIMEIMFKTNAFHSVHPLIMEIMFKTNAFHSVHPLIMEILFEIIKMNLKILK